MQLASSLAPTSRRFAVSLGYKMSASVESFGTLAERILDQMSDSMSGRWFVELFSKKKVFVSFDYENDKQYKYLLDAWHANPKFEFSYSDRTPTEIQSNDIGRIKAALTAKIKTATHTLVIVGQYANQPHRDRAEIGFKNWINFEINQSKANGNRIAAVKIKPHYGFPDELMTSTGKYIEGYSEGNITKVLDEA